jgi:hypothetical protein
VQTAEVKKKGARSSGKKRGADGETGGTPSPPGKTPKVDVDDPEAIEAKKAARKAASALWSRGQVLHAKTASALAQAHQLANLISTNDQWKTEVSELPTLNDRVGSLRAIGGRSGFWSKFLILSFAELKKEYASNDVAANDLKSHPVVNELVEKLESQCQKINALHNIRMSHV